MRTLLTVVMLSVFPAVAAQENVEHSRDYWKAIVEGDYALPEGESAYALIVELSSYLGSIDSELRDDFGYGIPAAWIYRKSLLEAGELRALLKKWSGNLKEGLGRRGDDSVLLRSFSALNLSLLAATDNNEHFMAPAEFEGLLQAALNYLVEEKDLRGWEEPAGWYHAAAHTADLLKFLARSHHLKPEDQARILAAIAQRLRTTDGYVFVHAEDERLAATVVSILARKDLDPGAFEDFTSGFVTEGKRWRNALRFQPGLFAARQNSKNFLRALHVHLAKFDNLPPELARLRKLVLTTLWEM